MVSTPCSCTRITRIGSNTGLGFHLASQLGDKAYSIILTSRTHQKAKDAARKLTSAATKATYAAYELDVADPTSVARFGDQIRRDYDRVDVLVNNAGINNNPTDSIPEETDVSLEATQKRFQLAHDAFATNCIGAEAVTYQILPILKKSLIFVTSGLGSLTLNTDSSHEWYGVPSSMYRSSKAAMNMTMTNWHKKLKDRNISVYAVCPGLNATEFGGMNPEEAKKAGAQDPQVGASIIAEVLSGKRAGKEGKFLCGEGKSRPW